MENYGLEARLVATSQGVSLPTGHRIPMMAPLPTRGYAAQGTYRAQRMCATQGRYGAQGWQLSMKESGADFARLDVVGGNRLDDAFSTRLGSPPPKPAV
jgi:hypothetical protein